MDHLERIEDLLEGMNSDEAKSFARALSELGRLVWRSDAGHEVVVTQPGTRLLGRLVDALANGHKVVVLETEKVVSPGEAAVILGVSRPTVIKWLREGRLNDFGVGTHHKVDYAEVLTLLNQRRALAVLASEAARQAADADPDDEPTPEEVVAAASLARFKGDSDPLNELRARQLAARARDAAARARKR